MLNIKTKPELQLIQLSDLELDCPPPEVEAHRETLAQVVEWAHEYLCRPHPELGREGPVCPYSLPSIKKELFFLAVCPGEDLTPEAISESLLEYRDVFLQIEPRSGNESFFKTILVLFPGVAQEDVPRLIDATQEALKPEYVDHGLMVGEFHPGPPRKAGLWNPDFLPLRGPLPMLVIRHMVPTDFGFLKHDRQFVEAYLKLYCDQIPAHMRELVRSSARELGVPMPGLEELSGVHPRVGEIIRDRGLTVKVHRHRDFKGEIRGPGDMARELGYDLNRITKSLFVRSRRGAYLILVAPADERVDFRRIAAERGFQRLELASLGELASLLGFSPGGVCPLAAADVPVVIDASLLDHDTVLVAAGEVGVEIEIDPRKLKDAVGATAMHLRSKEAMSRR